LNLTVCGAEREPVLEILRNLGFRAYVTPSRRKCTVVYRELADVGTTRTPLRIWPDLPEWAAGTGYTYIQKNGEPPPGLTAEDLVET
jgi:hypothetical protein